MNLINPPINIDNISIDMYQNQITSYSHTNHIIPITHNHIFQTDIELVTKCVNHLETNIVIDKEYTSRIIKVINDILTSESVNYNSKYLKNLIDVFNIFYSSNTYLKYNLRLKTLENNHDHSNNEKILLHELLCFKFVIKILSDDENDHDCVILENNISKFITNNIVLEDESPHFPILISFINISDSLGSYLFSTNSNYGLIYNYIKPWNIYVRSSMKEVCDLNKLLQILYTRKRKELIV
jgi:hypothetical protein